MELSPTSAPSNEDKDAPAHALEQAKQNLEAEIERAVAAHTEEGGSIEVSLNFEEEDLPEGGDNEAGPELMDQIKNLVEDFHNAPSVSGKGVSVRRLTAIDSDGDGEVAVRVDYDYEGYA